MFGLEINDNKKNEMKYNYETFAPLFNHKFDEYADYAQGVENKT